MQILRKITLKAVTGKIDFEKLLDAPNRRIDLMKVYGTARKAKPDQSDLGSYIRFSGSFRAMNIATGEMFEAGVVILPGIAQDLLMGALDSEDAEAVDFGFMISVKYDAESVTKYVYDIQSLMAPSKDDPLERLAAQMGLVALPKPAEEKEVETPAEEKEVETVGADDAEKPVEYHKTRSRK